MWPKFANCFSETGFTNTREKDPDTFIVSSRGQRKRRGNGRWGQR